MEQKYHNLFSPMNDTDICGRDLVVAKNSIWPSKLWYLNMT